MATFLVEAEVFLALFICWVLLAIYIMVIIYYYQTIFIIFINIRSIINMQIIILSNYFVFTQHFIFLIIKKRFIIKFNDQDMTNQSNLQIYEMFTSLFITVSKGQQILDSIRQVLTTFSLFHPLALFKYISKGNATIQKRHIIQFLEQNSYSVSQADIKVLFISWGIKDKLSYTTFMSIIYPFNPIATREISSNHLKNYIETQTLHVSQQILSCFFLLITQELELINKIEIQKQDSFGQISKDKIKKVIKNIKKMGDKQFKHMQNNQNTINSLDLVYFLRTFTSVDQSMIMYLIRKLGSEHTKYIQISKLEAFLKPWKKTNSQIVKRQTQYKDSGLKQSISKFNSQIYKKQLTAQLSRTLVVKPITRGKTRKDGAIKINQGQILNSNTKKQIILKTPTQTPIKQLKQHKKKEKQLKTNLNGSHIKLFIKFINTFMKNNVEIERLKTQLSKCTGINYLKIFKSLDKKQRGIITAEDLQQYYEQIGGVSVSINLNVLVSAFSSYQQTWLSYSQFCQILKPCLQRSSTASPISSTSLNTLISQILYLSLLNQHELLQIRRQFQSNQAFHIFSLINKESTGFINYQELKLFLNQLGLELGLYQVMMLLKKLDRGKNGVVTENQFVNYFNINM